MAIMKSFKLLNTFFSKNLIRFLNFAYTKNTTEFMTDYSETYSI